MPSEDERFVSEGSQLEDAKKEEIIGCLRSYVDIFSWSPNDIPGIDPCIIAHHLNVRLRACPIKQKKRHIAYRDSNI